ncbi:O-antigen ligase family protein [Methylobacter sp. S3L5C]|uniref:O-antigen ligase family protein n=1 Tax=Methylobacter sp. S3L5C TaxID=2839024 RepID=UPI001FADC511|nr:O-antigen ligase family protein [Methylobacter sp. S3L5C]
MALFLVFLMKGAPGYRFSYTDLVVGMYTFAVSYSEFLASDYSDAQNLMFTELTSVLFPYIFAKSLIEPFNSRYDFAKSIVLCLSAVFLMNLFENKMGYNLWNVYLGMFFPGQGQGWITTFRFGLARAAGPYGHCLIDGIIMAVGYRLQRWLQWSDAWPHKIKQLAWVPLVTPAQLFTLMILGGALSTLGKGQWLAGIIAAGIVIIGRSKKRGAAMTTVLSVMIFVGIPLLIAFLNYASVGRINATDDNQETAAYRYELVAEYMDVASDNLWWGWGLMKWPKVDGFESIDNHFLLAYLNHGVIAVTLLLIIIFGMMGRLIIHGMSRPVTEPRGGSLAFTLAAIYLMYFIAVATVAMMYQSSTLFFIITGLSESYLRTSTWDGEQGDGKIKSIPDTRKFKFKKVL